MRKDIKKSADDLHREMEKESKKLQEKRGFFAAEEFSVDDDE